MRRRIAGILCVLVLLVSLLSCVSYEEFTYARSGNVESANDVTSITVAKPAGTASGDLLIGVVITDGDTSGEFTEPTGWTLIDMGGSGNDSYGGGCTLGAWYLIAGDSEPGSYQWAWTTEETVYAFIIRITGHDMDNPIDAWSSDTGTDGFSATCPAVNTTVADSLVLRIFGYDSCCGWNANYPNKHIGITVESSRPGCESGAVGHCSGGAAYTAQATAGDTGTAVFQVNKGEGLYAWRTLTIAVRPAAVQYDLTMAAGPEEGGTATDLTNESPYEEGTVVSIKAEANEGYEFVNWTAPAGGFDNASAAETTFTMPAQSVTVTATFTQDDQYTLMVNIVGIGSVNKNPDQLTYTYNTSVALNAIPDPCWSFASWSDDLSGTENPTTIIMNGNKTVTATFTPIDCDYLDGWVEDGDPYTECVGDQVCTYQGMVYLDYACVGGDCVPTETDWRTDLIGCESCDDGDPCTIDSCVDGACVHTPAAPTATASSNSPVSQGATIQLTGGPDGMASYNWTGPGGWTSSLQNLTRPNATTATAGTYTLTVTNSNGCTDDATTNVEVLSSPEAPTVITQTATNTTTKSTTLNMNYTTGDFRPVEVRFAYKKSTSSTWSYTGWVTKSADGTYTAPVTGLSSNTKYEFKAELKYVSSVIESVIIQFTTARLSLPPSTGCFIATAAYGTPTAEQINVLREFRDTVLLKNPVGSQFVSLYYRFSPPVADFIARHEVLRTLVRELLVDPIVWVVQATGDMWRN
jgi:hypothetical protein